MVKEICIADYLADVEHCQDGYVLAMGDITLVAIQSIETKKWYVGMAKRNPIDAYDLDTGIRWALYRILDQRSKERLGLDG